MDRGRSRLSRRQFVVGGASLGLLAGCAVPFAQPVKPTRVALQRRQRTRSSPSTTITSVMISGVDCTIAVMIASGR